MRRPIMVPLAVGVGALAITGIGVAVDPARAIVAYLAAYGFGLSIALGALIFVMIALTARARWFVVLRRTTDAVAATLPLFALLFLPIAFCLRALYPWARGTKGLDPETAQALVHQRPWLNVPFFLVRAALYFAVWIALGEALRRASVDNDREPRGELIVRQRTLAAVGLPVMALTLTFAAFDWLMSINAGWTSDMFGVYLFAGGFSAAVGVTAVVAYAAHRAGLLPVAVTASHFHALGRILLMTVIFWTYIAFAQFFLMWIADLPREVSFYAGRSKGTWLALDYLLLFGRFVGPFLVLLSRPFKRRPGALAMVGAWLVAMHAVDIYWLVVPAAYSSAHILDLAPIVAVSGLALAFGTWRFFAAPPFPENDPDLSQSLAYESP